MTEARTTREGAGVAMRRVAPDAMLTKHPWPAALAVPGVAPLDMAWTFEVNVSPADLWPFLIDTSRFNRALGMGRFEYREEGGVLHGRTKNGGMVQEWTELPWTWVARRTMRCVRSYSRGFAHHLRVVYDVEPLDGGRRTKLDILFGWIPRSPVWRVFIQTFFPSIAREYARVLGELEGTIGALSSVSPYVRTAPVLTAEGQGRLDALAGDVRRVAESEALPVDAVARLRTYIAEGDELDLHRIQILALARRWRLDPEGLLPLFLHATRAGMLAMSWDVVCPHCRGVRDEATTLGQIPKRASCEPCGIDFETSSENAVEITFRPHPSIRDVPKQFYCAAEPATKLHIEVQELLAPGETRAIETTLAPGRYRLRVGSEKRMRLLDVVDGAPSSRVSWRASAAGDLGSVGPSPVLEAVNDGTAERMFVVETARWSDDALRPSKLFTLQRFRDLFSEEYLDADVQLSVGEQTILFTDMIGSTRFYDTHGDPQAFAEVRRHFAEVYEEVQKHRGAVVKTIGDAVMAAFADPVDALEASVGIHRRFPEGRPDSPIRLRISMNRGPCIAVNLNAGIDFFGRTVNVASKLQACVEAGQISFPRTMLDAPGVRAYFQRQGATLEEVVVSGKTLREPILAYRWDVNPLPSR